jgi:Flp pilus assembly protein TadG
MSGVSAGAVRAAGRRFRADASGTVAIEFALVAIPFLAFSFAIIETGVVYFAQEFLDFAVHEASRQILTGQVRGSGTEPEQKIRARLKEILPAWLDTEKVVISVTSSSSFSSSELATKCVGQPLNQALFGVNVGSAGSMVVVQACYEYPIFASALGTGLVNNGGSGRILVATNIFRNEPYSTTPSGDDKDKGKDDDNDDDDDDDD